MTTKLLMQILYMVEKMDNLNIDIDQKQETRRTANVISLMLPARMYEFECSWTTEQPLPAMEEFSCRLLLMLGTIHPNDLQNYFGLNNQEREVLLNSLFEKRLAVINTDGSIKPSSLLQAKSANGTNLVPSLTVFEERQEKAQFDLLSLQLLWKNNYSGTKWGLPEIEADSALMKASQDQICEAFSRQYRAHLENTRQSLHEAQKTRLYKIGQCQQQHTLQIPIDMVINLEPIRDHDVRIIRDVSQKIGEIRKFSLSNELEAKIADYLGKLKVSDEGMSIEKFCELFGDEVLARYVSDNRFDLSAWLLDRDHKKTGYGNQNTRALLGPVYLKNNRIEIERWLKNFSAGSEDKKVERIYWLPANVPLWAASGSDLTEFIAKIDNVLKKSDDSHEGLVTLFPTKINDDHFNLRKNSFSPRLPHGIALYNASPLDRVELMVFQGLFAIAQYHLQPNKTSGITIPIGFITSDPDRMARIENVLKERLKTVSNYNLMWSRDKRNLDDLLDIDYLQIANKNHNHPQSQEPLPLITYKKKTNL